MCVQKTTPSVCALRIVPPLFSKIENHKSEIANLLVLSSKKRGVIAFRVTSPDRGGDPEEEITPILSITVDARTAMGTGGEGLIAPSLRFACPPTPRCGMGD
jgi:hypothetical protein